eukprot:jgi/Chlat1/3983/Chrsp26S04218
MSRAVGAAVVMGTVASVMRLVVVVEGVQHATPLRTRRGLWVDGTGMMRLGVVLGLGLGRDLQLGRQRNGPEQPPL